jgi:hypothetical protein
LFLQHLICILTDLHNHFILFLVIAGADSFSVRKLTNEEVAEVLIRKTYLLTHFAEINGIYWMETFIRALSMDLCRKILI